MELLILMAAALAAASGMHHATVLVWGGSRTYAARRQALARLDGGPALPHPWGEGPVGASLAWLQRLSDLPRVTRVLAGALARVPTTSIRAIEQRIVSAGSDEAVSADTVVRMSVSAGALSMSAAAAIVPLPVALLVGVLAAALPGRVLVHLVRERQDAAIGALPLLADTVAMASAAGLSFDAASALYCERYDGPLAEELDRARHMQRAGLCSREDALEDIARRLSCEPVTAFVSVVSQSLRLGAPLAAVLAAQADEARSAHRSRLEERIAKAPVKMLLPMGAFILPAMLLLVLGPVVAGMAGGFSL